MTFRPSDDVLDEIANGQQPSSSVDQYNVWNQDDWQHMFNNSDSFNDNWMWENNDVSSVIDIPVAEEVKAPDLSELLKNSWEGDTSSITQETSNETLNIEQGHTENSEIISDNIIKTEEENTEISINENNTDLWEVSENNIDGAQKTENLPNQQNEEEYLDPNKLPDAERSAIVSSIDGAINSNLDFLVDKNRIDIIEKYRKLNHLFFRWGALTLSVILWVLSWIVLQVTANHTEDIQIIKKENIGNLNRWVEETSDKILAPLVDSGVDLDVIIPYWSVSLDWSSFQSKSNLVSYKWLILPQLSSINYKSDNIISLEDFNAQKVSREDIKNLIYSLIIDDSIYKKTRNLPNVLDSRWVGNVFQGSLLDGFSLRCVNSDKATDIVCDRFVDIFNRYGKYYDLTQYSSEVLDLVNILKHKRKDIEPTCKMINEYVLRAGSTSDDLTFVMDNCGVEYTIFYRKMIKFIELENSLGQPVLSDKVFDDPDLNAYKLLSAQQNVYRVLEGTSINENYIKSYLSYVQALINKDKGNNRYLSPIYKDILYVFNTDELYQKLMKKWKLSSEIKTQIDQINNWDSVYWHMSLISQLTTPDIVQKKSDFTGKIVEERTLDDIFSQYYGMTDRLKIRRAVKISDNELRVQTELFSDKILRKTDEETLKLTVVLRRQNNLLYVESIKVANQQKFSDILGIYASEWNITFNAMLNYIEEQVWMWYELEPDEKEVQPTFCEQIQEREDISVYACDDSTISLYKWDIEYNFTIVNGVLDTYSIGDENTDKAVKQKLNGVMFMKDNTPTIITSIIDFVAEKKDDSLEKKLWIIDQFRIHFKLVPDDIHNIDGKPDDFLVDFTLWEFSLQANYNINTHMLTKVSYVDCDKTLEIRGLTIAVTTENEIQLIEILNNPKAFFTQSNPSAYKKYQKMCEEPEDEKNKK